LIVSAPVIIFTERLGKGPAWAFVGAALLCALGLLSFREARGMSDDPAVVNTVICACVLSGVTYWVLAWKLYPPDRGYKQEAQTFE